MPSNGVPRNVSLHIIFFPPLWEHEEVFFIVMTVSEWTEYLHSRLGSGLHNNRIPRQRTNIMIRTHCAQVLSSHVEHPYSFVL